MYTKSDYKLGMSAIVFWAVMMIAALALGTGLFWTVSILSRPAAVISKTLDPNNIIHKYEWFYDTAGAIKARIGQVKAHDVLIKDESDPKEVQRLKIEKAGMQQSCRDMVAAYNANAGKANVSIFKTESTPTSFPTSTCE